MRAGVQVVGILSRVVTCLRVFLQVYTLSVCYHVFVCISTGVHVLEYCHVLSLVCVYFYRCARSGVLSHVITSLCVFLQVCTFWSIVTCYH